MRSTTGVLEEELSKMGGSPCSSSVEVLKRGAWTAEEDMILSHYIGIHGDGAWTNLPQKAGESQRISNGRKSLMVNIILQR